MFYRQLESSEVGLQSIALKCEHYLPSLSLSLLPSLPLSPPRRDRKGCSNGLHVLGYRIYVEGSCWKSVDGALTVQATLTLPSTSVSQLQQQKVNIHIRYNRLCNSYTNLPKKHALYSIFLLGLGQCLQNQHHQRQQLTKTGKAVAMIALKPCPVI